MDALRDSFERLRTTPGVLFMDLSTTYTLLPLMGEGPIESEWNSTAVNWHQFAWGERQVVVIPYWFMAVGSERINRRRTVAASLR